MVGSSSPTAITYGIARSTFGDAVSANRRKPERRLACHRSRNTGDSSSHSTMV
jgi:hypothetical protein